MDLVSKHIVSNGVAHCWELFDTKVVGPRKVATVSGKLGAL